MILSQKEIASFRKRLNVSTCPLTKLKLGRSPVSRAVLDHCHTLPVEGNDNSECGRVRGVLSSVANLFLGRVEKLWFKYLDRHVEISLGDFLINCGVYLNGNYKDMPIHPTEIVKWRKRLMKRRLDILKLNLNEKGISHKGLCKSDVVELYINKIILPLYGE